jgi:methylated-DNA-protein-cysteine methyltransferase-like protein
MDKDRKSKQNTFDIIYTIVKEIPRGKIATYGQIAAIVGTGLPARIVGYALHGLPNGIDVPWHRVINSQGKISYAVSRNEHDSLQQNLLEQEGIKFSEEGFIDLKKYLWSPDLVNK